MWTLDFAEFASAPLPRGASPVGSSDRSRWKHRLMSKIFGREIGVLNKPKFAWVLGFFWVDLTAGNGVALNGGEWTENCSPGILAHHARFAGNAKRGHVILFEKAQAVYADLLENLESHLPELGYERLNENQWTYRGLVYFTVINADSATFDPNVIPEGWAVQVLNDPNAVNGWAMDPTLMVKVKERSRLCLGMSTMGCNATGIKRLKRAEREGWYGHVKSQVRGLHGNHDLLLAAIEGDAHQWAYLITAPAAWKNDVSEDARKSFAQGGYSLRCVWLRDDPAKFRELLDFLFLTKSERGE